MEARREELIELLLSHYRGHGWPVERAADGTLHASGPGGVTWLGTALVATDLESEQIEARLIELSEQRMPRGGELCPLDLVAASECEDEVRGVLDRLGLSHQPHVSLYSLAC